MLGTLGEYLFGSAAAESTAGEEAQASPHLDLDTKDGDLGWVLVDVAGTDAPDSKSPPAASSGGRPQRRRRSARLQQQSNNHPRGLVLNSQTRPLPSLFRDADLPSYAEVARGLGMLRPDPETESATTSPSSEDCDTDSQDSGREGVALWDRGCHNTGRVSTLRLPSALGESWLVTPPPCFTGTGSINTELSSSPLENLLIEHPSMSVYSSLLETPHEEETGEGDMEEEEVEEDRQEEMGVEDASSEVVVTCPCQHRRPHEPSEFVRALPRIIFPSGPSPAQISGLKWSNKRHQVRESGRHKGRKACERANKVSTVQQRSCHKAARALRPSGCMNGRRSQRAY